ncbi:cytochrome P450 [Xylogone sp. PMI_703]|nr:cytochrome P450 [Xylogone sp. PMI_703]
MSLVNYYRILYDNESSTLKNVLSTIGIALMVSFVFKLVQRRLSFAGLPQLDHSFFLGHIGLMAESLRNIPVDSHYLFSLIWAVKKHGAPKEGLWYLDLYPVSSVRQILVLSPDVLPTLSNPHFLLHHHPGFKTLLTVLGRRSVTNAGGSEWKRLRQLLGPVFSNRNVIASVPICIEEAEVLVSRIQAISRGDKLIPNTYNLMMDFSLSYLCRVSSGIKTGCQRQSHALTDVYVKTVKLANPTTITIFGWIAKAWTMWKFSHYEPEIRRLLKQPTVERWETIKNKDTEEASSGPLLVIDAILKDYLQTKTREGGDLVLDKEIMELVADNCLAISLGGRDTTAATLSWVIFELSRNADILEQLRSEHSSVFGSDPNAVVSILKERPYLLNDLPWTSAVIKEVLRLYPPASGVRYAQSGESIISGGKSYPTNDSLIMISHYYFHRQEKYFPNPDSFIPQRFLPSNDHTQDIDPNVYRPFERGIRNCPGQEMAIMMIKVVLCLMVRKFRFEDGYEEFDRRNGRTRHSSMPGNGDRAYQTVAIAAYPKDGLPLLVYDN